MKRHLISFLTCLSFAAIACPSLFGQSTAQKPAKDSVLMGYIIEGDDTLYVGNIREVYVYNRPRNRKEQRQWRDYYKMVHNFSKAYPYALLANERLTIADSILATSNFSKRERDKFLDQTERDLFSEFEQPLRNLTFTQGRMLMRLIDREVGYSSFAIVKDYRGNVTAAFWQGVAKLFGADMKKPYDKYGEDKPLEELVQMYHDGRFYYLYTSLFGPPKDPRITPYGTRDRRVVNPVTQNK